MKPPILVSAAVPYKLACVQLSAQIGTQIAADKSEIPYIAQINVFVWGNYSEAFQNSLNHDLLLVSIPIGIAPSHQKRHCDKIAKQQLGNRSVEFLAAPKAAYLTANTLEELLQLGSKKEYFYKIPMIRDCRSHVQSKTSPPIKESHCELAFFQAQGFPMYHGKTTPKGIEDRLNLIQTLSPFQSFDLWSFVDQLTEKYPKSILSESALLDASILIWAAHRYMTHQAVQWGDASQTDPETKEPLVIWT